jgi:hypothetical protein
MGAPSLKEAMMPGIGILNTRVDGVTGTVLAQTGDAASQTSEADDAEWWQHVGLISRPSNPKAGQTSAEGFTIRRGDRDIITASRDVRGQKLAGSLQPGETCIYAGGADGSAQARLLLKANGSCALYTAKGNAQGGQSVTVQINADGTIYLASPFGGISIDSSGIKLMSAAGTGAAVALTATGTQIGGLNLALNASSVALGSTPGTGVATLAGMTPLLTALNTFSAALTTYATGIQSNANPTNSSDQITTTFTAAVAALQAALVLAQLPVGGCCAQSVTASWP